MTLNLDRRHWLQSGAALATSCWLARPAHAAGPVTDGAWTDAARQRSVPWRLRLPDLTSAGAGPWPLVLFSHGLGGSLDAGTVWGEAWAAGGMAVLHLQHPGSDTETLRAGLRQLKAAASAEQLVARVQDVRFVLDELARRAARGEAPWTQMHADAIGLAGHSFGAQTTQAIAGQRYPVATDGSDPRPRAFIAFSPSQTRGGRLSVGEAFGGITRPFLAITGSEDGDPFGTFDSGEPRAQVYQGLPPGQRALLWLDGADHMTFGGQDLRGAAAFGPFRRHGPAAERQAAHHAAVARITTDWWRAQLLADAAAREALRQPAGLGDRDRWQLG
jgi:predicted dienelactone hydrolase